MKLDIDRIIEIVQSDNSTGICTKCGYEQGCCEPDARKRKCESCDAMAVYGAEELLIMSGIGC